MSEKVRTRLLHEITETPIILDHRFGFRQRLGAVEKIHRVYKTIRHALEYCSSAFISDRLSIGFGIGLIVLHFFRSDLFN